MNYRYGKNPLIFEVIPTQYGFMADILDFCYNILHVTYCCGHLHNAHIVHVHLATPSECA